ncbi:MAG TPA: type II toxin-antitoxin system RelE/ParE family toxin [Acidobacteriota bacterium]|nr:type II toxin-antitoxin system RelE/ParE family toxin [bacterium]HNX19211.1 type II toxin-antitoxin system RelE/ParE family toxin [Acidobacteriota bacterium]
MILRRIGRADWDVCGICNDDEERTCDVLDLLVDHADGATCLAWLRKSIAEHGPPGNKEKSRRLSQYIYELKHKQLRLFYFFDEGRLIVVAHGAAKPSEKVLKRHVARAEQRRRAYMEARRTGDVTIIDAAETPHGH